MGKIVTYRGCFIVIVISLMLKLLVMLGNGLVAVGMCCLHPLVCRVRLSIAAVCFAPYVIHNLVPLMGYIMCLIFVRGIMVLVTYVSTITNVLYTYLGRHGILIASWCLFI